MAGPYREKMIIRVNVESFFRYLKRRRALGRGVQALLLVAVLVPSVLALAGVAVARLASDETEAPSSKTATTVDPLGRPWGFVVSRTRVEQRSGPVPVLAPRPTRADSPISPEALMHAIETQAAEQLRACYTLALQHDDSLGGELVASVLVRRDGKVEAASGGPRQLRLALGKCIERAVQGVNFGTPTDAVWVHVPLRFDSN